MPFGNNLYLENWLSSFLGKLRTFIQKVTRMRHTQSAFQDLLLLANNKVTHLTRSLAALNHSDPISIFLRNFDEAIIQAFQEIIKCPQLSHQQITQVRLPEKLSGLGLLSASQIAPAAFLGSARQSLSELSHRDALPAQLNNALQNSQHNQSIPWMDSLRQSWINYRQLMLDQNSSSPPPERSLRMFLSLPTSRIQHQLLTT